MIDIIPSGDSIIILKDLKYPQSSIISKEIEKLNLPEVEDVITLKRSIGVIFNPFKIKSDRLIKKIQGIIKDHEIKQKHKFKTWKIPICYDEEFAIDIQEISHYTKLDFEQIKQKHLNTSYDVQIIGFLPGFLYLGDIDKSLNVPMKNTPRTSIPEGSVAIAVNQTGIYNINSPKTDEEQYYRNEFNKHYPRCHHLIPYFWMPKYVEANDSSARKLKVYKEKIEE